MGKSSLIESGRTGTAVFKLKRRVRRPDIRINMIPMINLALLLLIFFKVSAYFAPRPRLMEVTLPTRYEILNPRPIPEAKLLRLFVDEDDSFYYQIEKSMDRPLMTGFDRLAGIISTISHGVKDPVMLLKLDPRASYESLVRVIDKIQSNEREINHQMEIRSMTDRGAPREYRYSQIILRELSVGDRTLLDRAKKERRK